jgi:hypothetical protein
MKQPFTITTTKIKSIAYDYQHQAWIINGSYARCNHPASMNCACYGRLHEGEPAAKP